MTKSINATTGYFGRLRSSMTAEQAAERMSPKPAVAKAIRPYTKINAANVERTWDFLGEEGYATEAQKSILADEATVAAVESYNGNIETMIGTAKIPLGIAGPVRVNGLHAQGEFCVPLATSEAALVASYNRGMRAATAAGGVSAAVISEGVMRSPGFCFENELAAGYFVEWVAGNSAMLRDAAESTTRFGKLVDISPHIENNIVFLLCRYETGDASGQNMCTIATQALCETLLSACPVKPEYWFIEANFSSDKKASALAFIAGRGRKVTASVVLPHEIVRRHLRTSVDMMDKYVRMSSLGGIISGAFGVQGHYANGLAAIFIATGQDVACVAECAMGITKMETVEAGMRFSVTLPSLLVGTVGGGTGLPSPKAALEMMGLHGSGKANAFAEVIAATCLAGELSIIAALSAGQFTGAHEKLARTRTEPTP